MTDSLDIRIYSQTNSSIKDLIGDVDISDKKWDFLFNETFNLNSYCYFYGLRLNYPSEKLESNLQSVSDYILFEKNNYNEVLLKMQDIQMMFGRNLLAELWDQYESSHAIFLNDTSQEVRLIEFAKSPFLSQPLLRRVDKAYVLSKRIEEDVIWIEQNEKCRLLSWQQRDIQ